MSNYFKYLLTPLFCFFVFIAIINLNSCDNSIDPPPTKSPREYEWTIDTLGFPETFQTLMRSIWGSSANNVYTCGHISSGKDGLGDLWHYDGNTWEASNYSKNFEFRGELQEVHGTSDDNVWVVGYKSTQDVHANKIEIPYIVQFNGNTWIKHEIDTKHRVEGVYAINRFEAWAYGWGGSVYHYNNSKWELDTIKVPMEENDFFIIKSLVPYNDEIYAMGYKRTSGSAYTQYHFFKKENGDWKELDTFNNSTSNYKFGVRLKIISPNKLLSYGRGGIYIWKDNKWEVYFTTTYPVTGLYAQGENNILAVGDFDTRYHHNGSNWQELNKINALDIVYTGVWATKEEAIIIGFKQVDDVQKTLVLHGK